jgi:hypothetical protein
MPTAEILAIVSTYPIQKKRAGSIQGSVTTRPSATKTGEIPQLKAKI